MCKILGFLLGGGRERDRERAAARAGGKGKNADDGLTPEQRRERFVGLVCCVYDFRDGKALQEKAAKKAAQAAAAAGSGGGAGGKGTAKK
uniref:Small EDRK-rich factor-like N-terminal domain-containing protein n=1 Tax=Brassica campestris TaxID=3711 RepID=M4EV88_BRACM